MLSLLLTATIDPSFAQVACPNPVPLNPSREEIVACMRDVQKLKNTLPVKIIVTPHRIGPQGEQTGEQIAKQGNKEVYFTLGERQPVPGSDGRICTISKVEINGVSGQCAIIHLGGAAAKIWQNRPVEPA
jgi:hypothetical protein